jgi:hypothetical protein
MAFAINNYTGNGSTTTYQVTFTYIVPSHVQVRLNNVLKTLGVDYTFPTSSTIQFVTAPANGVSINFTRSSSRTTRLVDYQDGSTITEAILDQDSNQLFFISQEAFDLAEGAMVLDGDNKYNANNKIIKNLLAPVNDTDAVNKAFITTNLPAINTVNTNIGSVAAVATNIGNVNSVASNSANINSAVGNATNINAVVANATNINLVSSISGNVTTVANNMGAVTTVANDINKVIAVANDLAEAISEIETVADDLNEATSEIDVVASNIVNVNAVGNNIPNINSVAGNQTNINAVFSNATNINAVSSAIPNINIAASNINSVNDFVARYRVSPTQPSTSLDIGDLWFDSTLQKLLIYTSSGWQTASDYVSALINVYNYTATNGQTVFTGVATGGNTLSFTAQANCFVFLNGIRIVLGQDYTLTGGNTVTLLEAANAGDLLYIEVIAKISITEEAILQGYVTTATNQATISTTQAGIATTQAGIATTQAGLATSNGATQVSLATAQVALATTQANLATTNGQAQVALATTQAGLATTNGQAQVALATTQATNSANSATASQNSATASSNSATASANSATASQTSATNSANSAAAAAASATAAAAASGGGTVSITNADTTAGKLNDKIVVSGSLTKTVLGGGGGAETLQLGVDVIFNETFFTATANQTTFNIAYTPLFIQCFVNGIKLINGQDFTATNGTSVILGVACFAGDVVEFVKFK